MMETMNHPIADGLTITHKQGTSEGYAKVTKVDIEVFHGQKTVKNGIQEYVLIEK